MTNARSSMKIVVIGGSGLIGSKLVTMLVEHDHQAVPASPNSGVNTLTGEGLAEVLEGASVVVDVSNSPSFEDAAVMEFFKTSTGNLLSYEAAAGVGHHVALSIVGSDRLPDSGYMRAKVAQEKLIKESSIPYSIVQSDAVLRVRQPHRRLSYRRQHGSPAACAFPADGGRRCRQCGGQSRPWDRR